MDYEKPICDCGGELFFEQDIGYTEVYRINKNGHKAKKKMKISSLDEHLRDRLSCHNCDNFYEVDGSAVDGFKLRRGDLIS